MGASGSAARGAATAAAGGVAGAALAGAESLGHGLGGRCDFHRRLRHRDVGLDGRLGARQGVGRRRGGRGRRSSASVTSQPEEQRAAGDQPAWRSSTTAGRIPTGAASGDRRTRSTVTLARACHNGIRRRPAGTRRSHDGHRQPLALVTIAHIGSVSVARQPTPRGPGLERQRPAVRLGDLPAQHQADARSAGLGGEERHEQVGGLRRARALVVDPDVDAARRVPPADRDARAAGVERRVGGVAQQVDQQLLDLVAVGGERRRRGRAAP